MKPELLLDLEKNFNVPVLEAYALSEGSGQVTFNYINKRKTSSIGVPFGSKVSIK